MVPREIVTREALRALIKGPASLRKWIGNEYSKKDNAGASSHCEISGG